VFAACGGSPLWHATCFRVSRGGVDDDHSQCGREYLDTANKPNLAAARAGAGRPDCRSQATHLLGVFITRFLPALTFTVVAAPVLAGVGFALLKCAPETAQPSARAIIVAGALIVAGAIAIFTTI
jgi:hypothetical protein